MIKATQTWDKEEIKSIICHEKLWALAGYTTDPKDFDPKMDRIWLKIEWPDYANDKTHLIGMMEFRELTKVAAEVHGGLHPNWRHQYSIMAEMIAEEWVKKNTEYRTVVITSPMSCTHVHKFAQNCGFQPTGIIPNGIVYNNKFEDLILLTKNI